ncbi:MAG: DUF6690 family protein [Mariniblastus sp.]
MFSRSILLPSLIVCVIAAPLIFSSANKSVSPNSAPTTSSTIQAGYRGSNGQMFLPSAQNGNNSNPFQQTGSINIQNARTGSPVFNPSTSGAPQVNPAATINNGQPYNAYSNPASSFNPSLQPRAVSNGVFGTYPQNQPNTFGMQPDFAAAQTFVFPGNANGPDLSAEPMQFIPVMNFEEIFRFDISPGWIKSRWNRVSTSPGDRGLHGLRVALVTGTNSWDLHGSLTYYFGLNQQLQRITFRGWAGDSTRFVNLLTQKYNFKAQPTHSAGFYLAQSKRKPTGGLLMQNPAVIYTDNPVQQVALVMEMNQPNGPFQLSDDFRSLIIGSNATR